MKQAVPVIFFLVLFVSEPTSSQWVQTNGPYGGQINALAASGTTLYAGTNGAGVYISRDSGATWTEANTGLPASASISAIGTNGSSVFVGIAGDAYRSVDGGLHWSMARTGLPDHIPITCFAFSGSNIFVGLSDWNEGGVFLSTDNGTNWAPVNDGLVDKNVSSLFVSGTYLFVGTYGGIFRSAKTSISWTKLGGDDLHFGYVHSFTSIGARIFAGTGAGVHYTTDNGNSWSQGRELTLGDVYSLAASDTILLAGFSSGVTRSTDLGVYWNYSISGPTSSVACFAISGTLVFAGSADGVYRSANRGARWTASSNGISNTKVIALTVNSDDLFAGVSGQGVSLSHDNGESWNDAGSILQNSTKMSLAGNGQYVFAGGSGLHRWNDDGAWWSECTNGFTASFVSSLATSGTDVFAATPSIGYQTGVVPGGVFRSSDNGLSWTVMSTGLPDTNILSVTCLAASNTRIVAATEGLGLFISTNSGQSWTVTGTIGSGNIYALAISGNSILAGSDGMTYLSLNDGAIWTETGGNIGSFWSFLSYGMHFFAGTSQGVYLSVNNGRSWGPVDDGLPTIGVKSLAISDNFLYAGTDGRGVWRRPIAEMIVTSIESQAGEVSAEFTLEQNYPNPFNPITIIKFTIAGAGGSQPASARPDDRPVGRGLAGGLGARRTSLIVYDLLGREVGVLVNELKAPGSYEVSFDGSGLASGIYFYRLTAGSYTQSRKMILIR